MVTRFDHVTIAVRDLDRAKAFFALLGFVEDKAVVISGRPSRRTWAWTASSATT